MKGAALANSVLAAVLRGVSFPLPAELWLGLYSDSDALVEIDASGYARLPVALTDFDAPSGGSSTLTVLKQWPQTSAVWGAVGSVALLDDETAGAVLYSGALPSPVSVGAAVRPRFLPGSLTVQES
jgi:hypothetical protein